MTTDTDVVLKLHREGMSNIEIAQHLGVAKSTISYHLGKHGICKTKYSKRYTQEDFDEMQEFYNLGHSISDVVDRFSVSSKTISRAVKKEMFMSRDVSASVKKMSTRDYRVDTKQYKKLLIKEGFLEEKCYSCGIGPEWNGGHLELQLHHVDGDPTNNSINNMTILCPNCHTQTNT